MPGLPILGFGVALAFWPGILSAATAPRWCLIAAGLPLVSWLDPRQLATGPGAALLALIAWAFASIFWASDRLTAEHEMIHALIFGAAVLAGANTERPDRALLGAAWGIAITWPMIILQATGDWNPVDQVFSPAGLFFNRDVLAESAAPLLVWAAFSRRWYLTALLVAPLMLCGSRVAIIAFGVGCVLAMRGRWLYLIFGAAFAAIGVGFIPGKSESLIDRLHYWSAAGSHPSLWGHGLGAFTVGIPGTEYAHSDILQAFYELGSVGVALGIWFAVCVARRSWSADAATRGAVWCLGIEAAISFPLHLPFTTLVAGLLAGCLCRRGDLVRVVRPVSGVWSDAYV